MVSPIVEWTLSSASSECRLLAYDDQRGQAYVLVVGAVYLLTYDELRSYRNQPGPAVVNRIIATHRPIDGVSVAQAG